MRILYVSVVYYSCPNECMRETDKTKLMMVQPQWLCIHWITVYNSQMFCFRLRTPISISRRQKYLRVNATFGKS